MKIKTITCHDVYNVGAGLQAYALSEYLQQQGHEVEIIDYKPDYLSRRYNLRVVDNPRYEKPLPLKILYLVFKLPKRLWERQGKRDFDAFREKYLKLTRRYYSLEQLKADPPPADVMIAGSDQIWNPLFQNGRNIIVESEVKGDILFTIGRIERLMNEKVLIRHFDADGAWEKKVREIAYSNIMKVSFDTRYITVFSKYLSEKAPT